MYLCCFVLFCFVLLVEPKARALFGYSIYSSGRKVPRFRVFGHFREVNAREKRGDAELRDLIQREMAEES